MPGHGRPEWVVTINQNRRSRQTGTGGHGRPEYPVLIAALSLTAALILVGAKKWPRERFLPVALLAVTIGVSYTVFSEWNNTVVTRAWSYSSLMPTIWSIGLSPLAQWFIVPGFAFWYLKPNLKSEGANL
jgi:uncharacterized membrane protein YciS (DUF1049 family)